MNDKHIQQVLEIEKQAQEIHDTAVREAQQLPVLAEEEARAILEKALSGAREEARKLVSDAQAQEEISGILAQAEERNREVETLAKGNFERAVTYILERIVGKE